MSLKGTDLALLSARIGVARIGAFRLGFYPEDVEGAGTIGPGEYAWREVKPEDDGQEWQVVTAWSMCAEKCVASFTSAPAAPNIGTTVTFTDTTTPAGEATYWHWDFGDGASSNLQNPTHVYAHLGIYTVTLHTSSPRGACTVSGTVEVVAVPSTIVEGTVTYDDGLGPDPCEGNTVELRDSMDVVQATTATNAAGFYQFVDPVVTMLEGEGFRIYVYSPGTCIGCVDTFRDGGWAVGITTVMDVAMDGT